MGEPRHEGACPPWWQPGRRRAWNIDRAKRLAYLQGHGDGRVEAWSEVYRLLEAKGFVKW